ncbi:toprim domain-containing protein [Maribacter polysaccharolyticus]|uniref:toprim domain-containing protein n=1 Tax=Maribacter polysaccharolyticus TaxID=3020831 RepID=UPI00237F8C8E|nr:toprim domain-containing protein [Maribacter polysaccharolyticus]MDE3741690.1 toprim domain-containing protein [Maribacter polysaccharolyticus]
MKEKRTNRLSCERARAFPIEKELAKLGHFPTKENEKEAWYLSPFRSETQASFKVSKRLNRWYDHGEGTGGNVIDLVCRMRQCTVKEALRIIGEDKNSFLFQQRPNFKVEQQDKISVKEVKELTHYALRRYLSSRSISTATAKKYISEVHYSFKNKNYFAIGFKNDSGGWELRNKYYKNCSSPKDITHIKKGNGKLIVTEGVFDLLSLLSYNEIFEAEYDFLVLNSTAFVSKAMEIMKGYLQIDLYLDNDPNGRRTTQQLMARSTNCLDISMLYEGFKDMNEWLVNYAKKGLGQEARDVSLLPQRQTRFTPDGRKEKEK